MATMRNTRCCRKSICGCVRLSCWFKLIIPSFNTEKEWKKSELNLKSAFVRSLSNAMIKNARSQVLLADSLNWCILIKSSILKVWENVGTSPPKISFLYRSAWVKSIFGKKKTLIHNCVNNFIRGLSFASVITLWNTYILNYHNMNCLPWLLMNKYQKLNAKWWSIDRHKSLTIIIDKTYEIIAKKIVYFIKRARHFAIPVGTRCQKGVWNTIHEFLLWNRPFSNSHGWTGSSMKWRLMWANLFKCKLICPH